VRGLIEKYRVTFPYAAGPDLLAHQNARMFSSCVCDCRNRRRKPLMYSSSGSCCCWCISSNARKTSMRCFFNITRSVCSNSRTTGRYRAVFKGLQVFYICVWLNCSSGGLGESCLVFHKFRPLTTQFQPLLYAAIIRIYGACQALIL
jgi:hypothetical protein